jgi:hypothetical protein
VIDDLEWLREHPGSGHAVARIALNELLRLWVNPSVPDAVKVSIEAAFREVFDAEEGESDPYFSPHLRRLLHEYFAPPPSDEDVE